MSDEGFHEIELKGKQLVFLFMAATVVSVVIFLCGVMVGRGVPAPRIVDSPALAADLTGDPTAAAQSSPSAADDDAPLSTQEVLTYSDRLDAPGPVAETLRPPVAAASNVPEPPSEPLPPAAAPVP